MKSIELFMWGYQSHFRVAIEILTKRTLELIGIEIKPAVVVVGLARADRTPQHPVCIEPEDGPWQLSTFDALPDQVEAAIRTHPLQKMFYGDALSMQEKPEEIKRLSIRDEVARLLRSSDYKSDFRIFPSISCPIGDYYVVCVIYIPRILFQQFPSITYHWQNESIETSFLEQCISGILEEARTMLSGSDPGRSIENRTIRIPSEIVARCARNFMRSPFIGGINTADLFERINDLSRLMYEGRIGAGRIIFAEAEDPNVHYVLRFATPVPLSQARWARKALQMATKETALIAGYDAIYGLGKISDVSAPPYCIDILAPQQWDFKRGDQVLMRTHFGEAHLPQEPISTARFVENMERIFKGIPSHAVNRFRIVLDLLTQLPRGSMLVIAEDAALEASRLGQQGTLIDPTPLTKELLERCTSIDGSIISDPDGICYAVGVILDGTANDECTPSRGARYNSAVRYVGGSEARRMAFVVSEDRTLDVIPLLRERVSRRLIEDAVKSISTATTENYFEPRSFLDSHRFFLNSGQCVEINKALDRIESTPSEGSRILWNTVRFSVNPAMNDDYLKD